MAGQFNHISELRKFLKGSLFSPGDFYWVKQNQKKIPIFKKGQILDLSKLERFEKLNSSQWEFDCELDPGLEEEINERFLKLKNIESLVSLKEKKRAQWRESFLKLLYTKFHGQAFEVNQELLQVSFSRAMEKEFLSSIDPHLREILKNSNDKVVKRCFHQACIFVLGAVVLGYAHYHTLQELFVMKLLSMSGLLEGVLSTQLIDDIALFYQDKKEIDKKVRFENITKAKPLITKEVRKMSSFVKNLLELSFEKNSGVKTYLGTHAQELSDIQVWSLCLDHIADFKNEPFKVWSFFGQLINGAQFNEEESPQRQQLLFKEEFLEIERRKEAIAS